MGRLIDLFEADHCIISGFQKSSKFLRRLVKLLSSPTNCRQHYHWKRQTQQLVSNLYFWRIEISCKLHEVLKHK